MALLVQKFDLRPVIIALMLLFGLFRAALGFRPAARAETETVLAIVPSELSLWLNGTASAPAQVYINAVQDLNAFDIVLTYDGALAVVTDYAYGGFLSNLECFSEINDPGYFRLACSQFSTPGVSGSGSLVNLTFSGISPGATPISITTAKLSDPNGKVILAQLQHGVVTVGYHTAPVTGAIFLQGQSNRAGISASLGSGSTYLQGPYSALSRPVLGANLDFGPVVGNDTYTLTTAQPGYLNLVRTLTVNSALSLPPLRLLAGDVLGDQVIGASDLAAIRDAFGTAGPGLAADVNFDGVIDVRDLALVGGNYGLSAAEAYADWFLYP
jgi:hypothetical protein